MAPNKSFAVLVTFATFLLYAYGRDRCFRQVSDVVIVIDSSFSIRSQEFQQQLSFLKALIDSFTIGQNHMQVGVVSFGSKVRMEFRLDEFQSTTALKRAVGKIKHMNSGTNTHAAIKFVHSQMFEEENGGRPWAKKKVVLITDGLASDLKMALLEASRARLKNVEIFCIGIGDRINDFELRDMASDPKEDHVFHVKNYKSLSHIKTALADAACDERPSNDAATIPSETNQSLLECKQSQADIFFLMDSSNSIWRPDFMKYIKFIRQVTSTFNMGQDAMRIGLIVYSDKPVQLLALSDTQTQSHLNRVLDHTRYISGSSNTAEAIQYVRRYGFTKFNKRPNCARIMVILTDGQSDDRKTTVEEAKMAHEEGIKIFTIGVGQNTDSRELMDVASNPDDKFVFHVDAFGHLSTIKELLMVKTCDVVNEATQNDAAVETKSCPRDPTDVVFMYDTTSLSLHHHNLVINSISKVIESDSLIADNLRFGVIREASKARKLHDIKLTDDWKMGDFKTKLDPGSKRSSAELLLSKARRTWDYENSDPVHKRTIFIFLDSATTNIFGASLESSRLRKSGVRIILVGLGREFDENQALFLASYPVRDNLIIHKQEENDRHNRASQLVSKLIKRLCQDE